MSIVKFFREAYGKQTLMEALKAGGWKAAFDGTLLQATVIHGPNATLRGSDKFGNKYYERVTEQYGRHRWVVYGDLGWPSGQDPTSVVPEWHGWLHQLTDDTPNTVEPYKPIYAVDYFANKTGKDNTYLPKGSWKNSEKRNWKKFEAWVPPKV